MKLNKRQKKAFFCYANTEMAFNFLGFQVPKESGYPRPWEYGKMIKSDTNNEAWDFGFATTQLQKELRRRDDLIIGPSTPTNKDTTGQNR